MSTKIPTAPALGEADLMAHEFFRDADRDAMEALRRVLVSRTSSNPMHEEPQVDWTEFEQELARFCDLARIRHMAKHCAIREAMYVVPPIVVLRDEGGEMRMLESLAELDPDLREMLKKA